MTEAGYAVMFSLASRWPHISCPPVWEACRLLIWLRKRDFTPAYSVDSFSGCFVVRGTQSSRLRPQSRCSLVLPLERSRVVIQRALAHSPPAQPCWLHSSLSSRG